jgi:WD40 repeat protein
LDLKNGQEVCGIPAAEALFTVSPDGRRILVTKTHHYTVRDQSSDVRQVWDLMSGSRLSEFTTFSSGPFSYVRASFSPDGRTIAEDQQGGKIVLRNADTGAVRATLQQSGNQPYAFYFSEDGSRLFDLDFLAGSKLWEVASGRRLPLDRNTSLAGFRIPSGAVWIDHPGSATLRDLRTGSVLARLFRTPDGRPGDTSHSYILAAPDGTWDGRSYDLRGFLWNDAGRLIPGDSLAGRQHRRIDLVALERQALGGAEIDPHRTSLW